MLLLPELDEDDEEDDDELFFEHESSDLESSSLSSELEDVDDEEEDELESSSSSSESSSSLSQPELPELASDELLPLFEEVVVLEPPQPSSAGAESSGMNTTVLLPHDSVVRQ